MPVKEGQFIANRYRVDQFLGRGGMAEVYKVWDTVRSTHLAMKLLLEDLALDKVFLRRFNREANALAKLQHPNIVRFYGLEQHGRTAFLLMDFIEGHTLRDEIFDARRSMTMGRILAVMQPVCSALQYAHNTGYIHCDMKPANIMIHHNGMVYIMDFGITRMSEEATATLVGVGTPAYMAPEQIRGADPVPQTDIYAVGVMLYEMVTAGDRPFIGEKAKTTGTTSEKIRWEHLHLTVPSPRLYNPQLPPAMEIVILRCLAKDPAKRYSNALELYADLQQSAGNVAPVSLSSSPTRTEGTDVVDRARQSILPVVNTAVGKTSGFLRLTWKERIKPCLSNLGPLTFKFRGWVGQTYQDVVDRLTAWLKTLHLQKSISKIWQKGITSFSSMLSGIKAVGPRPFVIAGGILGAIILTILVMHLQEQAHQRSVAATATSDYLSWVATKRAQETLYARQTREMTSLQASSTAQESMRLTEAANQTATKSAQLTAVAQATSARLTALAPTPIKVFNVPYCNVAPSSYKACIYGVSLLDAKNMNITIEGPGLYGQNIYIYIPRDSYKCVRDDGNNPDRYHCHGPLLEQGVCRSMEIRLVNGNTKIAGGNVCALLSWY